MPNTQFDVVIVGSGPAGIHAAYPLIRAGLKVAIVDGGLDSKKRDKKLSHFVYSSFRETSNAYDLIKKSSYAFNKTYQLLRIKSGIEIIQSLAKGGLSEQWHGICDIFTDKELERIGLPADEIHKEYEEVGKLINLKLTSNLDFQSRLLLKSYQNKTSLKNSLYEVPLAFPYRTSLIIDNLRKLKNFTYIPKQLVLKVQDGEEFVKIDCRSIDKSKESKITARYLILAAGSINTSRILLRSLNLFNYKTTFLTKAHFITACMHPRTFVNKDSLKKPSSSQLIISGKDTNQGIETFYIQLYKFNRMVIHKVLKHIPLPRFLSLPLLSFFAFSLMIADIRFPAFESKTKFCKLIKDSEKTDTLEISFNESDNELKDHKKVFNKITKQLRSLGLYPLKTVVDYTTSHYAGGVPYQIKPTRLSVNQESKLHQANRIYIADSSTWRALPSKAPTFTIMANASRVGKNVLRKFNRL